MILLQCLGAVAASPEDRAAWRRLVAWVDENAGYVNPNLYVDEVNGLRGIFTSADIALSQDLFVIPAVNIIHGVHDPCGIIKKVRRELRLGPDSFYAPLLDMQGRDPS